MYPLDLPLWMIGTGHSSLWCEAAVHERVNSPFFAGLPAEFLLPDSNFRASALVYSSYKLQNATNACSL